MSSLLFVHYFTGTVSVCVIRTRNDLWLQYSESCTKWLQLPVDIKSFVLVKNILDIFPLMIAVCHGYACRMID